MAVDGGAGRWQEKPGANRYTSSRRVDGQIQDGLVGHAAVHQNAVADPHIGIERGNGGAGQQRGKHGSVRQHGGPPAEDVGRQHQQREPGVLQVLERDEAFQEPAQRVVVEQVVAGA